MSIRAVLWAFDCDDVFSSPQKFVLVALANFADEKGRAYPSVATLAQMTKQNPKTVRKALDDLCESGIIADSGKRYGPTQQVKVYQFPEGAFERLPDLGRSKTPEESAKSPRRVREESAKTTRSGYQSLDPMNSDPLTDPSVAELALKAEEPPKPAITAEDIYQAYPLKVAKPKALAAIAKAMKHCPAGILLEKTQAYAKVRNGDLAYMPHPATWFNRESFNDDPSTWGRNDYSKSPSAQPSLFNRPPTTAPLPTLARVAQMDPKAKAEYDRCRVAECL